MYSTFRLFNPPGTQQESSKILYISDATSVTCGTRPTCWNSSGFVANNLVRAGYQQEDQESGIESGIGVQMERLQFKSVEVIIANVINFFRIRFSLEFFKNSNIWPASSRRNGIKINKLDDRSDVCLKNSQERSI